MNATNCRNCKRPVAENFCPQCGAKAAVPAITLHVIFHEAFHYFTHLDKGFGYTLKKLITQPGTMQREYIDGDRSMHQKPFSMFFLCGTISGLGYYFINVASGKIYGSHDPTSEDFFRHYFILLQAALLPLYTLVTWLFFKNQKYSYAETLIMMLYNLAFVFLVLVPIVSLNLVFPNFENRIVEVMFLLFYNLATNFHFYKGHKGLIVVQTILAIAVCYALSQVFSEWARMLLH